MTEYSKLLDAVAKYYGQGSDQWLTIATSSNIRGAEWTEILTKTPGVTVVQSKSGKILSYTVDDFWSASADTVTGAVNSNTQVASMANVSKFSVPANTVVDGTGKVLAESGLKTVSSGSTVTATLGKVAVGVGAVSAGIKLGTAIDGALYNANPDFWDSQGMSAINPQTWDSVCSTQGGKDVFNMVFGIDPNSGDTQAYLDENAFAQIAQYLAVQGAFNFDKEIHIDDTSGLDMTNIRQPFIYTDSNIGIQFTNQGAVQTLVNSVVTKNCVAIDPYGVKCVFASEEPFRMTWYWGETVTWSGDASQNTLNGKTFYVIDRTWGSGSNFQVPVNDWTSTSGHCDSVSVAYIMLYGDPSGGGVGGITPQSGATLPSGIDGDMTTAEVLARLQELYPNLFANAITNEVVQPDGSVETFTYVPVGFPDEVTKPTPTSELQPTGGTNTSQADDKITEDSPESLLQTFLDIFTTPDPYEPTEKPNPDDYPDTGDGVTPTPIIPTGSASALYSIYNPSQAQLNSFGAWLWSNDFVDQLKKIFNDPMQAIIGLHKIFATPATSGTGTIKVGYLNSNVTANLVSNQYTTIDCGTVNLYEYFGNSLDYTQTEVYLYLPFVGIVRLNTDDIMRGSINVVYKIDVLTGACLCSVNVTRDLSGGQLYTYSGNCAVQYPLSSGSYMGIVSGLLGIAGSVVGTVASGGAMLPLALGVGASAIGGMKTRVEHSGSISGNAGAMGIKTPYLIIRRPQTAIADNFRIYDGASQNKYVSIGSLGGYVRARYVNLENINEATGDELKAIEDELKNGILI